MISYGSIAGRFSLHPIPTFSVFTAAIKQLKSKLGPMPPTSNPLTATLPVEPEI